MRASSDMHSATAFSAVRVSLGNFTLLEGLGGLRKLVRTGIGRHDASTSTPRRRGIAIEERQG